MVNFLGLKITFRGNLAAGIGKGIADEFKCYDDAQIQEADLMRNMLKDCLPPGELFEEVEYMKALTHMSKGDYESAFKQLDAGTKEGARAVCVWLVKQVILKIVVGCPKLLSDALPMVYYY